MASRLEGRQPGVGVSPADSMRSVAAVTPLTPEEGHLFGFVPERSDLPCASKIYRALGGVGGGIQVPRGADGTELVVLRGGDRGAETNGVSLRPRAISL